MLFGMVGMIFDSISVCLSKGLGAPVGSVLLGRKTMIREAARVRKMMGGGMRQAGYLAAAGLYALEHHTEGLKQDHVHAKQIAAVLEQHGLVEGMLPVETNIIIFKMMNTEAADRLQQELTAHRILANKVSPTEVRFVFHRDVTPPMVEKLVSVLQDFTM